MKTKILSILLCCLCFAGTSCCGTSAKCTVKTGAANRGTIRGNGSIAREIRTLDADFSRLTVGNTIEVTVDAQADAPLCVEADSNILPYIVTSVENGTLRIDFRDGYQYNDFTVRVRVPHNPALREVEARSIASVRIAGTLRGDEVILQTASQGKIQAAAIAGGKIELKAASQGKIETDDVRGDEAILQAASQGKIQAAAIAGGRIELKAESQGKIDAAAEQGPLCAEAASQGKIQARFKGSVCTAKASSMGRITLSGTAADARLSAESQGRIEASDLKAGNWETHHRSMGKIVR